MVRGGVDAANEMGRSSLTTRHEQKVCSDAARPLTLTTKQQELRSLTLVCGACCPQLVLSAPPPLVPSMCAASARSRSGGVVVRVAPFVFRGVRQLLEEAPPFTTFRRR